MSDLHWGILMIQIDQDRYYLFFLLCFLFILFGFFVFAEGLKINVDLVAVESSVPVLFISVCRKIHNRLTG